MRTRNFAYLQLGLAMITVGSTVIASKIIAEALDPFVATALRFAFAFPIFVVLLRLTGTKIPKIGRRDFGLLVIQAAAGSVGYTVLLIAGETRTSAADAGVIIGTLPAAAAITAVAVLRDRPSLRIIGAVALATIGVVVVAAQGAMPGGHSSLLGDAMVLGAVFCECFFILLNKRLSTPWPPLAQAAAMAGIGFVVSSMAAVPALIGRVPVFHEGPLLAVLYYSLVPTVAGFWLWYSGSARVPGGEAAVFTSIAPIAGVILAWLVLGERLTIAHIAGLATVVAAISIISMGGSPAAGRLRR